MYAVVPQGRGWGTILLVDDPDEFAAAWRTEAKKKRPYMAVYSLNEQEHRVAQELLGAAK